MTRFASEPSDGKDISANRFGTKDTRQKPGAFRWWEPDCAGTSGELRCTGEEPPLQNDWQQPDDPALQRFAFRKHTDGSLEFRGHLSAEWKMSDTGRSAKFYKLTRKGRAHMASEAESWRRLTEAIGFILKSAEGEAP